MDPRRGGICPIMPGRSSNSQRAWLVVAFLAGLYFLAAILRDFVLVAAPPCASSYQTPALHASSVSAPSPLAPSLLVAPQLAAPPSPVHYFASVLFNGRLSNRLLALAESLALAHLLNRTLLFPRGEHRDLEDVVDVGALRALGFRVELDDGVSSTACPVIDAVYIVSGKWLGIDLMPPPNALSEGVTIAPDAAALHLDFLRADELPSFRPDDGSPEVLAPLTRRSEAWHAFPFASLLAPTFMRGHTSDPGRGVVFPMLVNLLAAAAHRTCLAVDTTYLVLDWRQYPQLFRSIMGVVAAPLPQTAAAALDFETRPASLGGLGGEPYWALHLRLTDFCVPAESCDVERLGPRIAPLLLAMAAAPQCRGGAGENISQLFLLTDQPDAPIVANLTAALGVRVLSLMPALGHALQQAVAEQHVASRAQCFSGCTGSTFSGLIRVKMELRGARKEQFLPFQYTLDGQPRV